MRFFPLRNGSKRYPWLAGISLLGICCTTIFGGDRNISHAEWESWKPYPILESCSRFDEEYEDMYFNNDSLKLTDWVTEYHSRVDEVIEEYLDPHNDGAIQCLEDTLLPLEEGSALHAMAAELPPWQDPTDLGKLDRNDIGIVLLEFLRVYECALVEHNFFLPLDIVQERFEEEAATLGSMPTVIESFTHGNLYIEIKRRQDIISKEIATARPTLERTLAIVSSLTRLGPLSAELECLQRASLDIRNGIGLAADASVCLPRGWDAKDPLRDL